MSTDPSTAHTTDILASTDDPLNIAIAAYMADRARLTAEIIGALGADSSLIPPLQREISQIDRCVADLLRPLSAPTSDL